MIGSKRHPELGSTELKVLKEDGGHPLLITDASQTVLDANDRFLLMSGFTLRELEGIRMEELLLPEDRERFAEHWRELAVTGTSVVTARLRTKGEFTVQARFESEILNPGRYLTFMYGTAGERFPEAELRYRNRYTLALDRDRQTNDVEF